MKAKEKYSVALDIGSHTVKMLAASGISNKPALVGFGFKKISGLSKEEISRTIKNLVAESRIPAKGVNISIGGPSVTVRFISMPKMKEEDLRSSIKFEAEKFIPFDINDCIIDFQILKKDEREHKFDILLVASKKGYVLERTKIVEEAGFSVDVVDVDSFAVTNAFLRNLEVEAANKTVAILNIGASSTNLSIISLGVICFARDILIGTGDVDVSGVPDSARPLLLNLMDDVKMSFSYHENQSGRNVEEIYLSGGPSEAKILNDLFQDNFGLVGRRWNALQYLDISSADIDKGLLDKTKSSFAVAAGLLLR